MGVFMANYIKGKDFPLNVVQVFNDASLDAVSNNVVATCLGVSPRFAYANGVKTSKQTGWGYKIYIPNRDLILTVAVNDLVCAVEQDANLSPVSVQFTNLIATFYVDNSGRLALSCKADKAESVIDNERESF